MESLKLKIKSKITTYVGKMVLSRFYSQNSSPYVAAIFDPSEVRNTLKILMIVIERLFWILKMFSVQVRNDIQ
jgi:hypothetical protein